MRIISGKARGTKLYTLDGENTRPTLDRVKESVFNIIQNELQDCVFLDLFSGSGAIGLEAASRGAKKVIMCDNKKDAINIIEKNIQKTHLQEKTQIFNLDFEELLKTKIKEKIDIIYIDPPYKTDFVSRSLNIIIEQKIIHEQSIIIIETDDPKKIQEQMKSLKIKITDERKYGRASILLINIAKQNTRAS